jgi:hypothetical protein
VQEFEQELAEQKSLLRSVASRGEEILTQHSTAEGSGGLGYVLKLQLPFLVFLCHLKKTEHLAP